MVHGELGGAPAETVTFTGACLSGIDALKYAFLAVKSGQVRSAVAAGSEKLSNWMLARGFEEEASSLAALEENPLIAFEKDFLRWMLSDGAGAALLAVSPAPGGSSLRVEWIDIVSYANEVGTCMWAGAERDQAGSLRGWRDCEPREWLSRSVFSFKQDVRLLDQHIAVLGARSVAEALARHGVAPKEIDWFLPHLSSMYFASPVAEALARAGCGFPEERWFVNLTRVGNVGAASIYLALEELLATKALPPGTRILLTVPESARFSYANALLTVV
jgi:3-oxoacyl-[acyl-carrier-protein] synthase-3